MPGCAGWAVGSPGISPGAGRGQRNSGWGAGTSGSLPRAEGTAPLAPLPCQLPATTQQLLGPRPPQAHHVVPQGGAQRPRKVFKYFPILEAWFAPLPRQAVPCPPLLFWGHTGVSSVSSDTTPRKPSQIYTGSGGMLPEDSKHSLSCSCRGCWGLPGAFLDPSAPNSAVRLGWGGRWGELSSETRGAGWGPSSQ